ncbi:GTP 3',8-cyclase MoaA [Mycobacterium branderi]|uniref:GTP 3',8-cyclase n=1 Tax=Mycobacterium branderi TaxID=43348 RepID=A0A7I7W0G6_9MYCO|nr:GTP 3',8-cyclase MoaA [Mycobacterium branderi]MCV7233687.1 GTP 3',8-cyclase MoaA [Mycobacterium branderi]ORA37933.1 cyclic pyranopterin phosphate synthase [Mycobacterium branderi]BBZ11059.1 GTP 3',8-cyclase 2 [Mycobacterium branderi]
MTVTALGVPSVRPRAESAATAPPSTGPLIDSYGRVATDLRVSLTDRCNLRCTYCMPAEGMPWLPGTQLLRPDEVVRLVRIGVTRLGITCVRFTGGEPLLAKHLEEIVAATAALRPRPEISLTTNGVGLAGRAQRLAQAGLDRVNVSLDSVNPAHFAAITRRDRLADVLAGLTAAHAAGLRPVKVNAVLDPQTGLGDAVALVRFCLGHDYQLRIIEQMPLDGGHQWRREVEVTADQTLAVLRRHFRLKPDPAPRGSAPAELWRVTDPTTGRTGTVGVIASVSHPFCSTCDRTRLTADGQIRSCLFAADETDLRGLIRSGADDAAIESAWRTAMWGKPAGHGINDPGFVQPARSMSAIGG